MAFEPKTLTDILTRLVSRVVARSALTDVEEGGELHTICAGVAREFDDAYFQMTRLQAIWDIDTATGEDLDERGRDVNPDEVVRYTATYATGSVVFSRSGTTGTVAIDAGTVVKVSGGPTFRTTAASSIANGSSSSASVPIVAEEAGEDGNVDAGAIDDFSGVSGVETVTNGAPTTGGLEQETDAQFRTRIKTYLRSLPRGTPTALWYATLTAVVDGYGRVTTAKVLELSGASLGQVEVYIDDGSGTVDQRLDTAGTPEVVVASAAGGETLLTLDNAPLTTDGTVAVEINAVAVVEGVDYTLNRATGQIALDPTLYPFGLTAADAVTAEYEWWVGLIEEAQRIIDGDASDRTNYPGYRAAGTIVRVLPPTVLQQTVACHVTVADGFTGSAVRAAVEQALLRYVNGLGIGDDMILTELIRQAKAVPGVYDIEFSAPTGNTTIGPSELARLTASNLSVT